MADTGKQKAKKPHGRPSAYTEEIASSICEQLSDGKTLREICRQDGMPDERTVRRWALEREDFSPQYARAREIGYRAMEDGILEIADDKEGDVQRARLQIDARKWLMSKALPKVYGDKVALEHTGANGGPIQTEDKTWRQVLRDEDS